MTSARFPFDPSSVGRARRWVASEGLGTDVELTKLLITELATNAVVHARSPFSVTVDATSDHVTFGVEDDSPVEPTVTQPAPEDLGGRGLFLVAALALRWGVERSGPGKRVWFDLPRE